jgi:hypothetical protein
MDNTSMTYVDTSLQHSTIRGQKEKENKKRKTTTKKVFHPIEIIIHWKHKSFRITHKCL